MEIWSKCDICGRDIPVGELCYGLKKGNCICKDCCTGFENCAFTLAPAPTLTPPNEPLTCEGCVYEYIGYENCDYCNYCKRAPYLGDYYCRRPPEGEEDT